jgi:hypothetical protein
MGKPIKFGVVPNTSLSSAIGLKSWPNTW